MEHGSDAIFTVGHDDLDNLTRYMNEEIEETGALRKCRCFTGGWTLQELIAPEAVTFFDRSWNYLFEKDRSTARVLSSVTGINADLLSGARKPTSFSIAQRMYWASQRSTTRVEDEAYSLLGLFGINLPLLYGEGQRAFRRLQEAIISASDDISIFA